MEKIKKVIKKIYKVIIIVICLVIFLAILEDIFEEEKMKIDTVIYNLIVLKMRNDFLTHIFKVITNFRWSIYFNWSIYIVNNINKK